MQKNFILIYYLILHDDMQAKNITFLLYKNIPQGALIGMVAHKLNCLSLLPSGSDEVHNHLSPPLV